MNKIVKRYLVLGLSLLLVAACHNSKAPKPVTLKNTVTEKPEDVVFGNKDARATVFMYASYQCTYCRYFFARTYPELKKNYLDTGKLKLVVKWLDFGERPKMLNALQAASCISRYGIYDKFHELMIVNPAVVFTPKFDDLLDTIMEHNPVIAECILDNDNYAYLRGNVSEFRANKLTGTPTFVMNNRAYKGYYSYENFKKILEKEFQL
ncbi:protein-disulfide isomerase [Prolixibacter denitrificans]|uniref:Protein-disulfide isomerase n=1 Tax=Prolixibacter denitrificans TaxID=1541063 RepID=A0A2P8CBU8_9BACT|nr:thioredoxin domain-containing protein [Prolixibacter denitrificans]PSK82425.1 protein-disulfide isomerase [Prolixibacter denitrificans]GET22833.1 thiol:disulfide interchange protein [Prolixibacter denitrificans]